MNLNIKFPCICLYTFTIYWKVNMYIEVYIKVYIPYIYIYKVIVLGLLWMIRRKPHFSMKENIYLRNRSRKHTAIIKTNNYLHQAEFSWVHELLSVIWWQYYSLTFWTNLNIESVSNSSVFHFTFPKELSATSSGGFELLNNDHFPGLSGFTFGSNFGGDVANFLGVYEPFCMLCFV